MGAMARLCGRVAACVRLLPLVGFVAWPCDLRSFAPPSGFAPGFVLWLSWRGLVTCVRLPAFWLRSCLWLRSWVSWRGLVTCVRLAPPSASLVASSCGFRGVAS